MTPRKETPIATRQAVINMRENGMCGTEIAMPCPMQRLQNWFDQLTINRQSRRQSRRRRNHSKDDRRSPNVAATSTKKTKTPSRAASHSVVRSSTTYHRDDLKPLPVSINFPPPPPVPMNGSFPRRTRIRTNPWIGDSAQSNSLMWASMTSSMLRASSSVADHSSSTVNKSSVPSRLPPTLCVISPDTSMCSSGYGSHDSSPDTSMVWTNSSEWRHYDSVPNDSIYHELMSASKMSESSFSLGATPSPTKAEHRQVESPIYAEPWTQYRDLINTPQKLAPSRRAPLTNCIYKSPEKRFTPRNEHNGNRPDMNRNINEMDDSELARDEYLDVLDQQIHELQMRSEELREMVEQARSRRKEYMIPKMECTFELAI